MKVSDHLVLQRLFVSASLALLAACNGLSQFGPLGGARQESLTPSLRTKDFKTIYTFKGCCGDGFDPAAGLIAMNGIFYGTTYGGGSCGYYIPCGIVFSVTPAGQEHVIYSFQGGYTDGAYSAAPLFAMNGLLYGTTSGGGGILRGTVFAVTTGGAEKVLHSFGFASGPDGDEPLSGLVNVRGTLYGTTYLGDGGLTTGTVFSITTRGAEKVLHTFGTAPDDGAYPAASLINVSGTLYGTTTEGGTYDQGTVFSVTTSGSEKVLYAFKGGTDGSSPWAGLVALNGVLYGTSQSGGTGCLSAGCGTVYSITTSGQEKVLYRFLGASDGADPVADLTVMKGRLYGTTQHGGGTLCDCGTIFSVTASGQEKVLHRFTGTRDGGGNPNNLISLNKVLYGTTQGRYGLGRNGTVFRLSP
jgi:uncharacterized repeat protein (TIGR03803 family)